MKNLLLASMIVMSCATFSFARDGQRRTTPPTATNSRTAPGRTGVGFNSQLSQVGVDAVSVRYWTDKIGFNAMMGFSLGDNNKYFDLGGKVMFQLHKEQNADVYGFGLLGIENSSTKDVFGNSKSETGVTIAGGLGIEFFLQGIPNLGFSTELGLGYNSASKVIGTFGQWIPNAGIHYYFQ